MPALAVVSYGARQSRPFYFLVWMHQKVAHRTRLYSYCTALVQLRFLIGIAAIVLAGNSGRSAKKSVVSLLNVFFAIIDSAAIEVFSWRTVIVTLLVRS